jgi:hypothetical protein
VFAWLISHQPPVLFSRNKPATNDQYFSLRTNRHQPSAISQTNGSCVFWLPGPVRLQRLVWEVLRGAAGPRDPCARLAPPAGGGCSDSLAGKAPSPLRPRCLRCAHRALRYLAYAKRLWRISPMVTVTEFCSALLLPISAHSIN